jgi:hypothetical protein
MEQQPNLIKNLTEEWQKKFEDSWQAIRNEIENKTFDIPKNLIEKLSVNSAFLSVFHPQGSFTSKTTFLKRKAD